MKNDEFYPLKFGDKKKERIQKESYKKWEESNFNGVVELPTGSGKSYLILMALLKHRHLNKLFVIVPKADLMTQIYNDIVKLLKVDKSNIGRIGNGFKEYNKPITIGIVNSIRNYKFSSELLIIDEFHTILSPKNKKILDGAHKRIMGLTATIDRTKTSIPIVYTMTQESAVNQGLISQYKLINIGCELNTMEKRKYSFHDRIVKNEMRYFNYNMGDVLSTMKFSSDGEQRMLATSIVRAIRGRKTIVSNSENKLIKCIETILSLQNSKIILFCEFIKTADYIVKELKRHNIKAAKFHSKLKSTEKQEMFDKFKNNEFTIMISVKALIEGTNIPDCDTAMILSGNSVKKDIVQQIGRVVRTTQDKDYAIVYQFYVKNTVDEKWCKERTKFVKKAALSVEYR